jgi:hypothetical protein
VCLRNRKLQKAIQCLNKELLPEVKKIQAQKQTKI